MLENIAFESRGTVAVWSSKHSLLQIISSAWGTRGVSFEERSMRNYLETENVEKFHMRFSRPPPPGSYTNAVQVHGLKHPIYHH